MSSNVGPKGLLLRRVAELDEATIPTKTFDVDRSVAHFLAVMQAYTSTSMGQAGRITTDPKYCDQIVDSCQLIRKIGKRQSSLIHGPLERPTQQWIGTNRHASQNGTIQPPEEGKLVPPDLKSARRPATKPFGLGLYTSTPTQGGKSMWRMYLDMVRYSSLNPPPWHVWRLEVASDASILEITSARDWATFIETFPSDHNAMIYPNWLHVSREFSGVHITLPAIAAAQGLVFQTRRGVTAPAFWDMEQTLWLRWAFKSQSLVEIVQ